MLKLECSLKYYQSRKSFFHHIFSHFWDFHNKVITSSTLIMCHPFKEFCKWATKVFRKQSSVTIWKEEVRCLVRLLCLGVERESEEERDK